MLLVHNISEPHVLEFLLLLIILQVFLFRYYIAIVISLAGAVVSVAILTLQYNVFVGRVRRVLAAPDYSSIGRLIKLPAGDNRIDCQCPNGTRARVPGQQQHGLCAWQDQHALLQGCRTKPERTAAMLYSTHEVTIAYSIIHKITAF